MLALLCAHATGGGGGGAGTLWRLARTDHRTWRVQQFVVPSGYQAAGASVGVGASLLLLLPRATRSRPKNKETSRDQF